MSKKTNKQNVSQMKRPAFEKGEASKTFRRIFTYLKDYKARLIFALVCMLVSVVGNVGGTLMLYVVIDNYLTPAINGLPITAPISFGGIVAIMGVIYALAAVLSYLYNREIVYVTTRVLRDVRNQMFEKMQRLPIKYFDTHTHGDLMSRYTNDTDTLREMLSSSIPTMIQSALTIIGVFAMMCYLSLILTAFIVVMLFIMFAVLRFVGGRSAKQFVLQQQRIGTVNGYVEEYIAGIKVVKVFDHEREVEQGFDNVNADYFDASCKANTYGNILMPIMGNLSYINYAISAIVGTILVVTGGGGAFQLLTWGKLVSFLQYSKQINNPISSMAQQINAVLMGLAGAKRVFELIDTAPEADEGYVELVDVITDKDGNVTESSERTGEWAWKHFHKATGETSYVKWQGEVELEDVSFGYEPDKLVLHDIDLVAYPGQKVAFVGSTGAGKTTITNLINRFYDVPDGKIRYDGININKIKKEDLRRSMAMVLQDTHLFTGTVRDNIRFGKLDATDEDIESAARLANADYFITHLPQGYDTMLTSDGANLSQGQRQLLSIARAAVANPPVLILDEATSSIDTHTEKLIEKGMDKLMEGRTVFVIAHRLSTVRNSNYIVVLEHGNIIERGTHKELLDLRGKYYQLYTGSAELE